MPDGMPEKPDYESLENRVVALEEELLHARRIALQSQLQLMEAALMNIGEKRPLLRRDLADVEGQIEARARAKQTPQPEVKP